MSPCLEDSLGRDNDHVLDALLVEAQQPQVHCPFAAPCAMADLIHGKKKTTPHICAPLPAEKAGLSAVHAGKPARNVV
jgi:hypothetical protein